MPKRQLPRFEVIKVNAGRFCVYDHLTRAAHWAGDPKNFVACSYLAEALEHKARQAGEEVTVLRADNPTAQAPRTRTTQTNKPK